MIASDIVFFNAKCFIRKLEFDRIDSPEKLRLARIKGQLPNQVAVQQETQAGINGWLETKVFMNCFEYLGVN